MPRLNWLFDLGLIKMKDLNINKTNSGNTLYKVIKSWDKITSKTINNCKQIFEHDFLKIYSEVFDREMDFRSVDHTNRVHIELIKKLINISFKQFRTLAPNRVTLSQVEEYVKYNIYWDEQLLIDTIDFRNLLKNKFNNIFIYKYLPKYQEGYIQKI